MNLTCSTCQNQINCANCSTKPTNFNQQTNSNKSNVEIIELTGTLQRNLGTKQDKNGKEFYFGTLKLDDDTEQVIFFFDPDYNLKMKLQTLDQGDRIKVSGFINRIGKFTVKELTDDGKYSTAEQKAQERSIITSQIKEEREKQGINELLEGGELDLREFTSLEKIEIDQKLLKTPLTKLNINETEEEKKLYGELGISEDTEKKKLVREIRKLAELWSTQNNKKASIHFATEKAPKDQLKEEILELVSQELNKNPSEEELEKLHFKAKVNCNSNQEYVIQVNYNSQSPFKDKIKELMITTPLQSEIESLRQENTNLKQQTILVEPIGTFKQSEVAIQRLLEKTEKE
ncbi:4583_t:CDS:2 [Entrophospora sp. SA101]|nr:4583_t:CDS:2 [Entrophospora sp. SA101]CAJ0825384.1 7656_t:CDS:2 [Entrophospora sp. SA101]CAJ0872631.1 5018_t:CDS:2 [Entrophospora sp. SA101]